MAFLVLGKEVRIEFRQGILVETTRRTRYPDKNDPGLACKDDLDNKKCLTLITIWVTIRVVTQTTKNRLKKSSPAC